MRSLNLFSRPVTQLPASSFPDRADLYICDKCGRDITKNLRPGHAHAWAAIGPERYACSCGQNYLTGAIEWDHLGEWKRKRRVQDTLVLGIIFSAMSSILGVLAYVVMHFVYDLQKAALVTGLLIAAVPFVLMQVTFWPNVFASMWRTRVGASVTSDRK